MMRAGLLALALFGCERTETFRVWDWDRADHTELMLLRVRSPAVDYSIKSYQPLTLEEAVYAAALEIERVTTHVCLAPTPTWLRGIKERCLTQYAGSWAYIPDEVFSCYGKAVCDDFGCIEGPLVMRVEFDCPRW